MAEVIDVEKLKRIKYEARVDELMSKRYSIQQELAIQRQKDTKPVEYKEYYDYAEQCKAQAKKEFGLL